MLNYIFDDCLDIEWNNVPYTGGLCKLALFSANILVSINKSYKKKYVGHIFSEFSIISFLFISPARSYVYNLMSYWMNIYGHN